MIQAKLMLTETFFVAIFFGNLATKLFRSYYEAHITMTGFEKKQTAATYKRAHLDVNVHTSVLIYPIWLSNCSFGQSWAC